MASRTALYRIALCGLLLLGAWVVTMAADHVAAATTYTVGSNSDIGTAGTQTQCIDPNNTACRLRDAIGFATSGSDTIVFNTTGRGAITLASTLTLANNVTITGPTSGAGVTVQASLPTVIATYGVFIVNNGVTAILSNMTIANGHNTNGGGILNNGTLTVTDSTFSGNNVTNGGGAIANTGNLTVTNSTFVFNIAASGGGGIFNSGTLTVTNSTVYRNRISGGGGGGILNNGTLNLTNTIVATNTHTQFPFIADDISGAVTTTGHNLIGTISGTTGITNGSNGDIVNPNPLLGQLANNGGPTQTVALLTGSPAIDAGNDTICAATGVGKVNNLDQRGITRSLGTHCDIGALEALPNATYTVGATGDTGNAGTFAECRSATNTTCQLRDALAYASSGTDTIVFNTTGRGTITLARTLKVTSGVTISGPTSGAGVTVAGGNAGSVFRFDDQTTSGISNLTIANGNTLGGESGNGGGIVSEGTLTVANTTLVNNKATGGNGGGIENTGTLTVTNSVLTGNSADFGGGGIGNYGTLTVTNSTFRNNSTAGGISATGGGIANGSGTVTVMSSTFSGNSATGGSGGIFNDTGGTLTVTNSTLSGNTAVSGTGSGTGGGIANFGTLTVTNSTLAGNSTDFEGGAIFNDGGTVTVTNSTLANNNAGAYAGGIMNKGTGAAVTLTNTTVSANTAGTGGGGISGPGALILTNTIVAGNTVGGSPYDINGVQGTRNHSLVGINPLLSALGDYGGTTQTMAPLPGSPAIGAGDPAVCTSKTIPAAAPVSGKDQRGVTRSSSLCAIGAFEPLLSAISLPSGSVAGGATVTLTGAGFTPGATVSIGDVSCTNVAIVNSTTLRCTTGVHGAGVVDVTVTVGSQTGTLIGGYTYGVVNVLPGPQPPGGSGGKPVPLPPTRPLRSPVNNTPVPLPSPRP